jgi:4-amino-4-deoxy-L-arabinose transferase-like glycosyltransferase
MIIEEMKRSFVAIVVLAALLRAPGLFTEFWLDEIRALSNVAAIGSAAEVFTGIHHDSNHWLVSLWMHAVGQEAPFWTYRLPSFLAGVAAVLLVGWLAEVDGSKPWLAMLLTATSFPLVFYSSEARGYALAALAGLAALLCLVRWTESGGRRWHAGYSLAASFGILSHLSLVLVLVAAVVYSLVLAGRGRLSLGRALAVQVVPFLLLGALVVVDLRYLGIGGGTREPPGALLAQTASLALGGPIEGRGALLFAALSASVLVAEIARRVRRYWPNRRSTEPRSYLWVFFSATALLPVWVALALDPPFLFPRYFLVSVVFVPLLVAGFSSSLGRPWPAVVLVVWLGANGHSLLQFAREGRGCYEEALRFLLEASDDDVIAVGSDHDLRNERVLGFYRERMGEEGKRLRYVSAEGPGDADFWIGSYEGSRCDSCVLLRSYRSSCLSGARWVIYRTR